MEEQKKPMTAEEEARYQGYIEAMMELADAPADDPKVIECAEILFEAYKERHSQSSQNTKETD